jgi:glycosyltransferase involved in cell wall biosynthesis
VHFPALEAGILAAASAAPASETAAAPAARAPSDVETFVRKLAPRYRQPLGQVFRGAEQALAGISGLAKAGASNITRKAAQGVRIGGHQFDLGGEDVEFAPGDWLVNLGASWDLPYEPAFLATLRAGGVRFAVLIYDLIPELFPEWTIPSSAGAHRTWLMETVPQADAVFAISQCTAGDLTRQMAAADKHAPAPVVLPVVLPVGGVSHQASGAACPVGEPYVLLVSTLEVRKNHLLMFRLWRRLLNNLPADQVPALVFAGKPGWLTADLLQQLANCNWLDGKIRYFPGPSEPELAALYENCLFTVFPSFYEGWGLPVTESLSFGKTVAAANRAAIPEAGGDFCAYYDPDNLDDAYNVVAGLIQQPARVAALEARIAASFRAPGWADTAAAILDALAPAAARAEPPGVMASVQSRR